MQLNWVLSLKQFDSNQSFACSSVPFISSFFHQFNTIQVALNSGFSQAAAQLYK